MCFELIGLDHPLRRAAEDHVRATYAKQYGAVMRAFPATLAALIGADGAPVCVAGVRMGTGDWFSQCYLDRGLEEVLSQKSGQPIAGDTILEVSGMTSTGRGASFRLLDRIAVLGRDHGMRWGVFTATRRLRHVLAASRLPLIDLGPASRDRVRRPRDWGSYYDTDPRVCALPDSAAAPLAFLGDTPADGEIGWRHRAHAAHA